MPTRRDVMQGAVGAASLLAPRFGLAEDARDDFALADWTGESFVPMHAIRDGLWNKPLPPPERRVEALRRLLPEALGSATLRELRLTRWGHQHVIPSPGIVTRMRDLPKHFGNVLLAHSDGQGAPAVESAITEGLRVAGAIRSEKRGVR